MEEKARKPKIRFKGFTDAWEQRKLGELGKAISGIGFPDKEQGGKKGIPFYKVSDMNNDGNEYEMNSANNYVTEDQIRRNHWNVINNVPAILFAKVGAAVMLNRKRIARKPFLLDNNSMTYTFDKNLLDSEYTKALFEKINLPSLVQVGALPSYNASQVENIEVKYPKIDEQIKIGGLIDNIDNLITLHQRKYDKLLKIKKAMLEKMFPKNGSNIPEIRFKGYTDTWEQRKLGELGKAISGIGFPDKEQGGKKGIPFYKVSDMNNDGNEYEMNSANNYVTEDQIRRNHWNVINNVPAILFAKVGAAVMLNRKRIARKPFLLDNNSMTYTFDKNLLDSEYTKALFEKINLPSLVQVGALPSYNASQVENIEVKYPKIDEQIKIGGLIDNIDNLITLHQRKLEKLKNIKKSLLEKMFI